MRLLDMAQNSCFSDKIDCKATKVWADAYLQKSHPSKGIPLKTTQALLKIFRELYSAILKPIYICESSYFPCLKCSKYFVHLVMLLKAPAPFNLIIAHYLKKQGYARVTNPE